MLLQRQQPKNEQQLFYNAGQKCDDEDDGD